MKAALQPGVCRHCGCAGEACTLPDGDKCGWTDRSRTVCNAPGCQRAEAARVRAARAARPLTPRERIASLMARGWGYGAAYQEVRDEMRRGERARRRGRGKRAA